MIRSRVLLSATLLTLYSATAFGLGMGKLELNSALNQVFSAEIQLVNIGRLQPEEIIPSLATQDDFNRYGVERTYILTDLDFVVRGKEDGSGYYLEVTSDKPIREPFLNFIVEVLWPSGKILSEFTVLLDPPVFGDQGVAPIETAETQQPTMTPVTKSSRTRVTKSVPSASSMDEGDVVDDEYGLTGAGDTLWTIALKVRPDDSVTVQQTMLALQRLNPEAFINNNINLLKAGHVLRIPDAGDIREDSTQEAVAEVRAQNQEFQDYKSSGIAQMDATRRQRQDTSGDAGDEDGELKLLAADRSSGQRAGDSDARTADIENELAITREDLDRARRANNELNVRLDDLAGQIETFNEIVKLKDDQLAAWRAELPKVQDTPGVAPDAGAKSAKPAAVAPAAEPQGSLLTNPFVIGGLLLLVVGALVAGMLVMRRRKDNATDDDFTEVTLAEPEALSEGEEESLEDADEADAAESEEAEDLTQQTSDPISEAEIYIAYGRFPQAIEFLQNAIETDPKRADIQLKLLEVYVATEDSTEFNLLFEQLQGLDDAEATAAGAKLQEQLPGAAETAAAAMDATIVSSEPIEAIVEEDDDDDLSFDLDDLDAETEDDDLDLGDDLDLEDDDEDVALSVDDEELDLELGDTELDIDLDADLDADETVSLEEGDLDIDLESDLDDTVSLEEGDLDLGDLEAGDEEADELDLGDDELDLGELDLGEDELDINLDDDDAITLDIDEDDDFDLDDALNHEAEETLDLDDDDDAISLDLDVDDDINLDDELNLEAEAEPVDDDDTLSLDLDADDDLGDLDLGEDDLGDLDLSADDDLGDLNLDDDDGLNLDLDDEDLGELNLDEDASSKLDLARAYIDMGDSDGARTLLNEVTSEGDEAQIKEANDLLGSLE